MNDRSVPDQLGQNTTANKSTSESAMQNSQSSPSNCEGNDLRNLESLGETVSRTGRPTGRNARPGPALGVGDRLGAGI